MESSSQAIESTQVQYNPCRPTWLLDLSHTTMSCVQRAMSASSMDWAWHSKSEKQLIQGQTLAQRWTTVISHNQSSTKTRVSVYSIIQKYAKNTILEKKCLVGNVCYQMTGYVHHRATILDLCTTTSAEFVSITVLAAMSLFHNKTSQRISSCSSGYWGV